MRHTIQIYKYFLHLIFEHIKVVSGST